MEVRHCLSAVVYFFYLYCEPFIVRETEELNQQFYYIYCACIVRLAPYYRRG